jgi:hypothetical protein
LKSQTVAARDLKIALDPWWMERHRHAELGGSGGSESRELAETQTPPRCAC